jgi:hypothetical protein
VRGGKSQVSGLRSQVSGHKLQVRVKRMAALAQARAVRERILAERGGLYLSDVAEDLHRLREERDLELAGLQGRKRNEVPP